MRDHGRLVFFRGVCLSQQLPGLQQFLLQFTASVVSLGKSRIADIKLLSQRLL